MARDVMTSHPMGSNEMHSEAAGMDLINRLVRNFDTKGAADLMQAVKDKLAEGANWKQILAIIWPLISDFISGKPITIQSIIDAVKAIFVPTPGPVLG